MTKPRVSASGASDDSAARLARQNSRPLSRCRKDSVSAVFYDTLNSIDCELTSVRKYEQIGVGGGGGGGVGV